MAIKLRALWLEAAGRRLAAIAGILMFGVLPVNAAEPLTVTVDQAYLLRLQRDADVVMIANPRIADVVVESARMIFVLGLQPGETNLYILDGNGTAIIQSAVFVVPNDERQVTVNRASEDEEATYSCTPRCASVPTPAGVESQSAGGGAAPSGDAGASDTAANGGTTSGASGDTTTETADPTAAGDGG